MKKLVLLSALLLCYTLSLHAANFTSSKNGIWNNKANWSGGGNHYPGEKNTNDNATIDGEAMTLAMSVPYGISSLTLSGGSLTMNSGGNLTTNTLNMSGGSITINSGATLTLTSINATNGTLTVNSGGLLIIKGTGTLAGTFTLVNNGTITLDGSGGGAYLTSNLTTFSNAGLLNINTAAVTESSSIFMVTGGFNNTGVVTIYNGTLKVGGIVTNTGALVIKSTADYTGMLIHNTSNINATIERYIVGNWSSPIDGWHLLSSPVTSQNIYATLVPVPTPNFVRTGLNGGSTYQDFYYFSEPLDLWINSVDSDGNHAFGFEDQFIQGKGYLVSYPEGHQPNPRIFTGVINTGDFTINTATIPKLTRTENNLHTGWNLLGNPFASSVKWNDGNWSMTNIGGIAKIWSGTGRSYTDVNPATGGIIPITQGFMVNVSNASGATLTIPSLSRTTTSINWMKETTVPMLKLVAHSVENSPFQESTIMFNPMATPGYDNDFDSYFFSGYAPMFYSSIGSDEYLSTNCLPVTEPLQASVNMGFVRFQGDAYTIEAANLESFPQWTVITLEDKKTGQTHDLTVNPVYAFTSEDNDDPERFVIHFDAPGVGIDPKIPASANPYTIYSSGNNLFIAAPDGMPEYSLTVTDILGRTMTTMEVNATGTFRTDVNLEQGIYVVTVCHNGNSWSKKVFIGR